MYLLKAHNKATIAQYICMYVTQDRRTAEYSSSFCGNLISFFLAAIAKLIFWQFQK
jgi:hypothetical protein